jgi:CRISPR-associated protein Cas1
MKHHLNTLYVTTEGAFLAKQGETVCVRIENATKLRVPLINLEGIVCFGNIGCSPQLFGACAAAGVSISFLNTYGGFLATVKGFSPGNVLLRRAQYRMADSATTSAKIVKNIVLAKLSNSRTVLMRGARDSADGATKTLLIEAGNRLIPVVQKVKDVNDVATMRGLEGTGARIYFDAFSSLLRRDKGFVMSGRTRRPPLDPVNALLSFFYSLLAHDVRSACESVGLDAAVGFLHTDRPGRPGLALDLMEELRAPIADRLTASLINRGQVVPEDFIREECGAYRMSESLRKKILTAYQQRKEDELMHPYLQEKISLGIVPHIQARLLARYLRGDLDGYPPFIWR